MMTRRTATLGIASTAAIATLSQPAEPAAELPAFELPAPRHQDGKPLMEALTLRRSIRAPMTPNPCRRSCSPICCGRRTGSIARQRVTAPRPIGGTSW